MAVMISLSGLLPLVPTSFTKDGEVDADAFGNLLTTLEPEVDGLVALGTNGEAAYSREEVRADLETLLGLLD